MDSREPLKRAEPPKTLQSSVRTLKIEAHGDSFKGRIRPKIRIMGRWLERAGFKPGTRVRLTCVAPGIIELRSAETASVTHMTAGNNDAQGLITKCL